MDGNQIRYSGIGIGRQLTVPSVNRRPSLVGWIEILLEIDFFVAFFTVVVVSCMIGSFTVEGNFTFVAFDISVCHVATLDFVHRS